MSNIPKMGQLPTPEKSEKIQASLLTPPGWVVLVSAPPKATAPLQSYRSVHAPATPICQSPRCGPSNLAPPNLMEIRVK